MRDWIDRLVRERYRTVGALAKAIGMTESGFSRAAKAGTFDVENCLRLALETGEAPGVVFELAGKGHVHHLLVQLYGKSATGPQVKATKLYATFSACDERLQTLIEGLMVEHPLGARRP
jgi:hypothetical protein